MNKIFIASGCSFTFEMWNWPTFVANKLKFDLKNVGMASMGNGLISKRLIYSIDTLLRQGVSTNDIIAGVMWSGVDRFDFYSDQMYHSKNWGNNGHVYHIENPTSVVKEKKWYMINAGWSANKDTHPLMLHHYEYFHSNVESMIKTIQNILLVQWYCKEKGVKYFMTTYMDIFHPYEGEQSIYNEEVSYWYDMIDFSNFLPITGCYQWMYNNYKEEGLPKINEHGHIGNHPTQYGHEKFAEEIVVPFILNK